MKRTLLPCLAALALPSFLWANPSSGGADFDAMDSNRDGTVSEAEFLDYHLAQLKRAFAALDKDGNNLLEKTELGNPEQTASGPRFSIPQIITVKPEASIHPAKVTAGARGPSGPTSRRISR